MPCSMDETPGCSVAFDGPALSGEISLPGFSFEKKSPMPAISVRYLKYKICTRLVS